MAQTPSATEVRSFVYTVFNGVEPTMNLPVGRLIVQEVKSALSRYGLTETRPDYGFRLLDDEGKLIAEVSPGYYPFLKKVIEAAAPMHSPACDDDCRTEIGAVSVVSGE